jgi:hypothetical protein
MHVYFHAPSSRRSSTNLPQVIRVVIRNHQRLAQNRLPIPMRNFGEQIRLRIFHQIANRLQIFLVGLLRSDPMPSRPEAQPSPANTPWATPSPCNRDSIEKSRMSSCAIRRCSSSCHGECSAPLRRFAAQFVRKIRNRLFKIRVSFPTLQQLDQVLAQSLVVLHA